MPRSALQLISSGGFYGAERVLVELASFLRDRGWQSYVGVFETQGQAGQEVLAAAQDKDLPTVVFACSGRVDRHTPRRIRDFVNEYRIDIVHSHGYKPDLYLVFSRLPEFCRRIVTCHSWYSHTWKLKLYEWMDKISLRWFDRVAVVAPYLREAILRAGLPPGRVSMIENGITEAPPADGETLERLRRELRLRPGEKLVLRVARLAREKRMDILLHAFSQVVRECPARLIILGEGNSRPMLEALMRELALEEAVTMPGYREDIPALLRLADVFVVSSDQEGLPIALLEAMSVRLPVVSTAVGAIPKVLSDGDCGILVPPDDPAALAKGILRILQNPDQGKEMAERAHDRFQREHSQKAMGEKYLSLYEEALSHAH
ncbi:MAG: glycosyltransferase family 4 protein [Planctomycetota bacterium]